MFFGSYHEEAEENAEKIAHLAYFVEELTFEVHSLRSDTNESLYMFSEDLHNLYTAQNPTIEFQTRI